VPPTYLRKNLSRLRERVPEVAAACHELDRTLRPFPQEELAADLEDAETYFASKPFLKVPRLLLCFGVGRGARLLSLAEQRPPATVEVVVIERNLARFTRVLQSHDLTPVLGDRAFTWFVGLPREHARRELLAFFGSRDRYVFLESFETVTELASIEEDGVYYLGLSQSIEELVRGYDRAIGNSPGDTFLGFSNVLTNARTILERGSIAHLAGRYRGVPGVVVSSGPSLDASLEHVAGLRGKAVIAAADSAVNRVRSAGLEPHLVTIVERDEAQAEVFRSLEDAGGMLLVASTLVHPASLARWPGRCCFVQREEPLTRWFSFPTVQLRLGPSCGNASFALLHYLGCDPILLLGQDLAFDRSGQRSHFQHCTSLGMIEPAEQLKRAWPCAPVEGNDGRPIETTAFWDYFRFVLEQQIEASGCEVYNVLPATSGARIRGARRTDSLVPLLPGLPLRPGLDLALPVHEPEFRCDEVFRRFQTQCIDAADQFVDFLDRLEEVSALLPSVATLEGFQRWCELVERELKTRAIYVGLLFPLGSPFFLRNLIHFFKWDERYHGQENTLRERRRLLSEWCEVAGLWAGRMEERLRRGPC